MSRVPLSTTDYSVLGVVWRDGPCTTYTVMLRMAKSPSSFYRKRASSTYATVQKLTKLGLLQPVGDEVGKRGDRPIEVTDEGKRLLRKWLSPPVPPVEAAYSNDLIRLRFNFITALDPDEQAAFVRDARSALTNLATEHEQAIAKLNDPYRAVTLVGLLYETRARIAWLDHVQTLLPIKTPVSFEGIEMRVDTN